MKHWNRLSKEVMKLPAQEVVKDESDKRRSEMVYMCHILPPRGGLNVSTARGPFPPHAFMVL